MSGNNNNGFFGAIQHSVNSFFYSLTTNDRYASYDSPYRNSGTTNRTSTNESAVSLVDNTGSNRSSVSTGRPFQYRPGLRSQLQNNASGDLQLQDYINGQPPLPSIESIWERLEQFLDREYPEMYDVLGEAATMADLNEFENDLECTLPSDVRESFQIHDGQESKSSGLFFGLILLELESVTEEWSIWKKVSKRLEKLQYVHQKKQQEALQGSPSSSSSNKANEVPKNRRPVDFISKQKSVPEGAIQPVYAHPQWIPLARDYGGNNIAVDLAPGPKGRWGQIILFGRDFDTKYVVANSWTEFLLTVVEDYEEGNYLVDPVNETICFYENNRAVDYLRVLVHRAWAPLKKAIKDQQQELVANTTALKSSKNNSHVDLPKETLITPFASTADLPKTSLDNSEFKLEYDEEEEEEESTEIEHTLTANKVELAVSQEEVLKELPGVKSAGAAEESNEETEIELAEQVEQVKKDNTSEAPEHESEEKEIEVAKKPLEEGAIVEPPAEEKDDVKEQDPVEHEELEESTVDLEKEIQDVKEKMEEVAL